MEKTAEIRPGVTPDTERRLPVAPAAKAAAACDFESHVVSLDNDTTKRLADAASRSDA